MGWAQVFMLSTCLYCLHLMWLIEQSYIASVAIHMQWHHPVKQFSNFCLQASFIVNWNASSKYQKAFRRSLKKWNAYCKGYINF